MLGQRLVPFVCAAVLVLPACKKTGGAGAADDKQAPDSDGPSDAEDGANQSDGNETGGPSSMTVTGSLALGSLLQSDNVSAVLGISAGGQRVDGEYDAGTGAFQLELPKDADKNYVVLFLNGDGVGSEKVAAKLSADDLNILGPTADSPKTLGLGELAVGAAADGGAMNASTTSTDAVHGAMGLSATEAEQLKAYDNAALSVLNVDVDGDGTVDEAGDFALEFSFGFTSAPGDPNQVASTLDSYKNQFLPDSQVIQRGRFSLTVKARKSLFATVPSAVSFVFAEDADVDDTGTPISIDGGAPSTTFNQVVPAGSTITKDFQVSNDPDNQSDSYQFGLMFGGAIPKGTYVVTVGGKTLTFIGVNVAGYNTVPPVVPFIKFNVDGADKITGINYKWMARNAAGDGWELATVDLIKMYVEKFGGHFSMYVVVNGQKVQKRLEWRITPEQSEGEIAFAKDAACLSDVAPDQPMACASGSDEARLRISGFSTFEEAADTTWPNWGWNNFTFVDKLGMMVSVN